MCLQGTAANKSPAESHTIQTAKKEFFNKPPTGKAFISPGRLVVADGVTEIDAKAYQKRTDLQVLIP